MVREKNRQRCSNPIVQRFLNDQSLGYVAIDDHVKRLFYEQYMEPLDSILDWMMHQKENAKQIILHKSGQKRIPKTPQRNNYMMRVKSTFDSRKKELLTSHTSGFTNEEDDDQPSSRVHTAIRKQNIQKIATPKSIPKRIKQEVISPPVNDLSHLPVHSSRDHVSRITEASPSRFRALTRKDLKSPDLFSSPNKTLTPSRIPGYGASSASRYQQSAITKPNQSPYVEAVKAVIAEQEKIRKALSPGRPVVSATQPNVTTAHSHHPPVVKKTRNSEYVREIERKAKTVISNREEIIKERAERVKREREERAERVQRNNRLKEKEEAARMAIVQKREREIEEMRKAQASAAKGLPKTRSPARTPRSADRQRQEMMTGSATRNTPQKPPRKMHKKDAGVEEEAFRNEVIPGTPDSTSPVKKSASRLRTARDTFGHKKTTHKPERVEVELPEVEVSMSAEYEYEEVDGDEAEQATSTHNILASIHSVERHADENRVDQEHNQQNRIITEQSSINVHIEVDGSKIVKIVDEVVNSDGNQLDSQEENDVANNEEEGGEEEMQIEEDNNDNDVAVSDKENLADNNDNQPQQQQQQINASGVDKTNAINNTSLIQNKNLLNATTTSSYELTPEKKPLPSTEENYNIDDLSSGDETDDEDQPRKAIPAWAKPENLRRALRQQRAHPPIDVETFFGAVAAPDLEKLFSKSRTRYRQRTSSAVWSSPLSNPTKGTSKYFAIETANRR